MSQRLKLFQFSVKRLLLITTVVALLLAMLGKSIMDYQRSIAASRLIQDVGGTASWNPEFFENLYRYQTVAAITGVRFPDSPLTEERIKAISQIPYRFGLHLQAQSLTCESFMSLTEVQQMFHLVLSNTSLTEDDVLRFQSVRPDVEVMFGYPHESGFQLFPPLPVPIN